MNKKIGILIGAVIIIIVAIVTIALTKNKDENVTKKSENFKIVTSFYPMYIMTANLTQGAQNIELMNLTANNSGCLHDYTLTTADMKKIENANAFIENGLGLESFMTKIIDTYPNLKIIDSSENIMNKIEENGEVNPHIWTSIENYIKQLQLVSQKLCEYNPENEEIYTANCDNYVKVLNEIKLQYSTQLQKLNGKKAICLNEAFTYLARDLQMNFTTISTNHEESTLSAETIKSVIEKMRQENIEIIFVGAEDDLKNAQTLANETGAKIYKLESGLTGTNSKDSYINSMKGNLEVLRQIGN